MFRLITLFCAIFFSASTFAATVDCQFVSGEQTSKITKSPPNSGTFFSFDINKPNKFDADELLGHGCYSGNVKVVFDGEKKFNFTFEDGIVQRWCRNEAIFNLLPDGNLIGIVGLSWNAGDRYKYKCNMTREEVVKLYQASKQNIYVENNVTNITNQTVIDSNSASNLNSSEVTTSTVEQTQTTIIAENNLTQVRIDNLQNEVFLYSSILVFLKEKEVSKKDRVLQAVNSQINFLNSEIQRLQSNYEKKYMTPIRPTNTNLQQSTFRASEVFPKVPFYIIGTSETGMIKFNPKITDTGYLNFEVLFVDPVAEVEKVRDKIVLNENRISGIITGLAKVLDWTEVAQENKITRRLSKPITCLTDRECPEKELGNSSAELIFETFEDGSTAGKIQINKGKYSFGYNFSVESSILLTAYLLYMEELSRNDFNFGQMSDEQVLDLFN